MHRKACLVYLKRLKGASRLDFLFIILLMCLTFKFILFLFL